MKRIGLFGGSFDPIHTGHVRLARFLVDALALDRLIVVPAAVSPFKTGAPAGASDADRLELCHLALPDEKIEVSDIEIAKGGVSYWIDTVRAFASQYPGDELCFVVGEDQLLQFHKWRDYREILSLASLVAVRRETDEGDGGFAAYFAAHPEIAARSKALAFEPFPVSSTEVRAAVGAFADVSALVPPAVETGIYRRGLYLDDEIVRMIADVKARLSEFRFFHSMCVADAARRLALRYGGDPKAAFVAGVLHDATKELSRKEGLAYMDEHGVCATDMERRLKKLHHAITGADYAKRAYDPGDEIVSAIRYHTTGKTDMTLPEKILFVADFISDDRDYPGADGMRRRAEGSLELCMEEGLRFTIEDLAKEGRPIHPDTVACYNQVLLQTIRKEQEL